MLRLHRPFERNVTRWPGNADISTMIEEMNLGHACRALSVVRQDGKQDRLYLEYDPEKRDGIQRTLRLYRQQYGYPPPEETNETPSLLTLPVTLCRRARRRLVRLLGNKSVRRRNGE